MIFRVCWMFWVLWLSRISRDHWILWGWPGGIISLLPCVLALHRQNVNRSGSHRQTFQTLWSIPPVLLSHSWCSRAPLELSKVLSDSSRAFSDTPESTCSYGGAFRMRWHLTYRIVKCQSRWNLWEGLPETSRAAWISVLCCGRL